MSAALIAGRCYRCVVVWYLLACYNLSVDDLAMDRLSPPQTTLSELVLPKQLDTHILTYLADLLTKSLGGGLLIPCAIVFFIQYGLNHYL